VVNGIVKTGNMTELSTTGLKTANGIVYENCNDLFRFPYLTGTCERMMNDETLFTAVNAIKSLIRRVDWGVKFKDKQTPTEEEKDRIAFIESCMGDMETSWSDFVNEAITFLIYGYSLHEKVYKTRSGKNSKFSDGKIGWKKLPPRAQNTITKWVFDNKVRNIISVEQNVSHSYGTEGATTPFTQDIKIPYKKLLHFKHDCQKGNPEGNTPLKACYNSYKYKNTIAEFEAVGVSKDMNGVPVIGLPPEYLSPDATDDKKAVYAYFQEAVRNLQMNESAGLVIPRAIDPETKQDLFEFRLESVVGSKQFDTDKIINRYENKILMAFVADVLKMGTDAVGSLALSDNKTALFGVFIEAILKEFVDVINRDLIPQTALLNGWDISKELPIIFHDDLDERDLDKLGGFIQRVVSVGAMEVDQGTSDFLKKVAKMPKTNPEKPINKDLINPAQIDSAAGKPNNNNNSLTSNRVSSSKQSGVST